MSVTESDIQVPRVSDANRQRPARLWPAWIVVILQGIVFSLSITPGINNAVRFGFMMLGPAVGTLLFAVWLLLASRISWRQRLMLAALLIAFPLAISPLVHKSLKLGLFLYGGPLSMLLVVAALMAKQQHRVGLLGSGLVLVWGLFPLGRLDGFSGNYLPEFAWRWSPTPEQKLISSRAPVSAFPATDWNAGEPEWPGFRGRERNGRTEWSGVPLNWTLSAPTERWRVPVGPAWSSFAYASGRLFTQEQRGDDELVTCYNADDGSLIWVQDSASRFSELVSGAGPRATPTIAGERIYSLGATGILLCLNASTGEVCWQHSLTAEMNAPQPMWGFSSSPLVIDDCVVVYVGADDENGLVAFDIESGKIAWRVASSDKGFNYSSAQLMKLAGRVLVVFGDTDGLFAVDPADGTVAWRFRPSGWSGPAMCQVQRFDEHSLVVPLGDGIGVARLTIQLDEMDGWKIDQNWSSNSLKPSFNDFVIHDGHIYGFDQNIFVSLDADTGDRNWKRGRYGFGQVLLLPQSAQMIVATEQGDLVALDADSRRHSEAGRISALNGKTWNHPILVGTRLYVRNGEFAICYELASGSGQ